MPDRLVPGECLTALERALAEHAVAGASLSVAAGDRVETVVRGVANPRAAWPVTPGTLFQLGSVGKIYTAILLLGLADRGAVDLDAPVIESLPEWRGVVRDERMTEITARHLLSHTAGLQSQHFEPYGRGDDAVARLVSALRADELVHPPGRMFSYSNTGYAVAGRLVEVAAGVTWHEAVRRSIVEPLGLGATVTLPEEALLHPAALGTRLGPQGRPVVTHRWYGSHALAPSGCVSATSADLVAVALAATTAPPPGSRQNALGLTAATVEQMVAPQVPVLTGGTLGWGLGWTVFETAGGGHVAGHNGDTPGQAAALRVVPQERFAVALLVNTQVGAAVTGPIVDGVLERVLGIEVVPRPPHEDPPAHAPEVAFEPLVGTYGQDRYEVSVSRTGDADGPLSLSVRRWGHSTLDWFGQADMREQHRATVTDPRRIVADGSPWWFIEEQPDGRAAYVTNGHLVFPRRANGDRPHVP